MIIPESAYQVLFVILVPALLFTLYLVLGNRLDITDNPGGRSSHTRSTITGAGVVYTLSLFISIWHFDLFISWPWIIGLILVVGISFIDDLYFLKHSIRFVAQLIGVALLLFSIPQLVEANWVTTFPIWIAGLLFGICVLNGFNFMDGINGMLSLTSMVVLGSLAYLNASIEFVEPIFIYSLMGANLVFLFLNLRPRALAFMGDAGSIGLSFSILYLVYLLIAQTNQVVYLLLFSVIGIDSGLTVIYKLILKENIFVPHRDFLFKKLVHVGKYGHVRISVIYAGVQAMINLFLLLIPLSTNGFYQISLVFLFISLQGVAFIYFRNQLTKTRVIKYFARKVQEDRAQNHKMLLETRENSSTPKPRLMRNHTNAKPRKVYYS